MEHQVSPAFLTLAIALIEIEFIERDETLHLFCKAEIRLGRVDLGREVSWERFKRNSVGPAPIPSTLDPEIHGFGQTILAEVDQVVQRDVGFQLFNFDV